MKVDIVKSSTKKIIKNFYVFLNIIGILPFMIGFIFIPIVSALNYMDTIIITLALMWPWYIIGLILIVVSSIKICLLKRRKK